MLCGACEKKVDALELPAELPARIERHLDSPDLAGTNRRGIVRKRSTTATPCHRNDNDRPRSAVLEPQARHTHLARMQPPEPDGIASAAAKHRIGQHDGPPWRDDRRAPGSAGCRQQKTNENRGPEHGRSQSNPRPDFLIRPSAVSDSTILSSTPLMNVLLPGVE